MAIRATPCLAGPVRRRALRRLVVAVMVVLAGGSCVAAAGAATGPRFSTPAFTPGVDAWLFVTADFNGDATLDVATIDEGSGLLSVLLGKGDGNFRRRVISRGPDGNLPEGIAVADVNGDGRPDVLVVSFGSRGPIGIWINDGDGRFHRDGVYRSGTWADGLVAADLNADGVVDLVTENQARRELVVLLGMGGGRFAGAQRFTGDVVGDAADAGFGAVAIGDVNGDGKPDAVLISLDTRLAVVRLGNGDGTFGPELAFGEGRFGQSVTLADLNHDNKLDVAAGLAGRNVAVFLGNGDGTFGATARYEMGRELEGVAVGDFDGDGNPDMATVALGENKDDVRVRAGRGDGTFVAPRAVRAPLTYGVPVAADFNSDGRPDLAYLASHRADQDGVAISFSWDGLSAPPCVVGFLLHNPFDAAERNINRSGCRVGHVRYRYSRRVRKHRVISQRPRSGAVLPNRALVNVVVSRGRRPPVSPQACGATRRCVRAAATLTARRTT
jgi:VCBS repeat protein